MFSWRFYTDRTRTFVLLVALSLILLSNVSARPARSMPVAPLLVSLERDLAALRAQLELVPAESSEGIRTSVAFNAGIADGGVAFRWQAIATIVRGADRRLVELGARYRGVDDVPGTARVDELRVDLRALENRLTRLRLAPDGAEARQARVRAEQTLGELERTLGGLHRPGLN